MACKNALDETKGDLDGAVDLLRKQGAAAAVKKADRAANEGLIGQSVTTNGRVGVLIEVNCETDFVAKNEELLAFGASLAELVATKNPADVGALGTDVENRRQALVQKIGENITVRRFQRVAANGKLALYLHGTKIGVLADVEGADEVGKDVAMHIAFAKPQYMTKAEVPADVIAREREILSARAKESGKPAEIVAKMVEGGLNKFAGEMTLLGQPFVKDDKQTVEKMLAAKKAKVHAFRFLVVGEGIEKKSSDFAAEVAAMAPKG